MFRPKKPLLVTNLGAVPKVPGVYIVYVADGSPFYIGRSIVNIYNRLYAHASSRGSKKINEALKRGQKLSFEWEEMGSPHQAEAQLITALGT